jgi:hypothetical protein
LLGKHHQLGLHTTQEFIWFIWVGSWWSLWAGESVNRTWWLAYPLLGKERSQPSPQTLSWAVDAASLSLLPSVCLLSVETSLDIGKAPVLTA